MPYSSTQTAIPTWAAAPKLDDLGTRNARTAVSAAQCFRISEIVGLGHHIDDPGDRYSIVTGRATPGTA